MPSNDSLSSSSEHVTNKQNLPDLDTPTPVQLWTVPDESVKWALEAGNELLMDVETAADNAGPAGANANPTPGTEFGLAYREPTAALNEWSVFASWTIDAFNRLSIPQQMDDRGSDSRTIQFIGSEVDGSDWITFDPNDEIALVTNGDDKIEGSSVTFDYDKIVVDS